MTSDFSDDKLWDFYVQQDFYVFQEFSTGIIGIGALFFAYGELIKSVPFVANVIAFLGLGGSLVLWIHMYGARKDGQALTSELGLSNRHNISVRMGRVRGWRHRDRFARILYFPPSLIAAYFMGLSALGWSDILAYNSGRIPIFDLILISAFSIEVALFFTIYRKLQDLETYHENPNRPLLWWIVIYIVISTAIWFVVGSYPL